MIVTHGTVAPHGTGCVLSIGNFDGAHRGHQAIFQRLVASARALGVPASILTFEPHPREFFSPGSAPARIARLRDKLERIAAAGIDRTHVARFDARFASLSAERFVEDILVRGFRVRSLLVGTDFRFGARRAGDIDMLRNAASAHGFALEALPEVNVDGERVSSSAVRSALQAGDFARTQALLGRPYTISGRVAHGKKVGRTLGFPTANIMLRREPAVSGIFVVEVEDTQAGWRAQGAANVGRRPTVNEVPVPLLEVHLLAPQPGQQNLYGRHLRVTFRKRIRAEEKYDGLEALRAAIASDVEQAKDYFRDHG